MDNVHIVWLYPNGNRILDRLARTLAEQTGWSISDRPRKTAVLNYFMLYVDFAQRFSDWKQTPLAAYFSHYEEMTLYKIKWWRDANALIDIKTITAPQYAQSVTGNVMTVIPPLDQEFFRIKRRKKNAVPTIGVSGFVDKNSGRKNETAVYNISCDLTQFDFVSSGNGWPVKRINNTFEGLPDFYNSLDVYLCTSTIEGIPMPPLEALACGVPIVIPRGVGLLDELSSEPGVYRYDVGDNDGMKTAVKQATEYNGTRKSLRAIVSQYTVKNWAKSHIKGFTNALKNKRQNNKKTIVQSNTIANNGERSHHGNRGLYVVAYGEPARDCATGLIQSWRNHMTEVPIALASGSPLGGEDVYIPAEDVDIGARLVKLSVYDNVPKDWQYVLYLDADTEVVEDVSFLYELLEDGYDMVICRNPGRFHTARNMVRPDNKQECDETFEIIGTDQVLQLNGGVFAFQKNERTRAFFTSWVEEWKQHGKRDQAALLRALWKHPLKLYVLGNEWNTITRYDDPAITAGILHYPMTARRWRGVVHGRSDSKGAWQKVLEFSNG